MSHPHKRLYFADTFWFSYVNDRLDLDSVDRSCLESVLAENLPRELDLTPQEG